MAVTITGRSEIEKLKGEQAAVHLTAKNSAILKVVSKAIGENRSFVVNKLVSEIALTNEMKAEVDRLIGAASDDTAQETRRPAGRPRLRATGPDSVPSMAKAG